MMFSLKIYPEQNSGLLHDICPKIPKFYLIIARKIFLPIFGEGARFAVPCLLCLAYVNVECVHVMRSGRGLCPSPLPSQLGNLDDCSCKRFLCISNAVLCDFTHNFNDSWNLTGKVKKIEVITYQKGYVCTLFSMWHAVHEIIVLLVVR